MVAGPRTLIERCHSGITDYPPIKWVILDRPRRRCSSTSVPRRAKRPAIPGENRVVLDIGRIHVQLHLFLSGRTSTASSGLDEASSTGPPDPSAAEAAPEAYASGWDAAIAFCDASLMSRFGICTEWSDA